MKVANFKKGTHAWGESQQSHVLMKEQKTHRENKERWSQM